MTSYKVEINVGGIWLPTTHKYFKQKDKAKDFERRFNNQNFPFDQQKTRVRKVGREDRRMDGGFFLGSIVILCWVEIFSIMTFLAI